MKVRGNLLGLKPAVLESIERLQDRRVGTETFVTPHFALALQDAALAAGRRVGVLADRRGAVTDVIVGDATSLPVTQEVRKREGAGRLAGVRLIHAVLSGGGLAHDDLETLRMLSLDATIAVIAREPGHTPDVQVAWLLPSNASGRFWEVRPPAPATGLRERFDETVRDVETQMRRDATDARTGRGGLRTQDAAIVVLPLFDRRADPDWAVAELRSLCATAGVAVVEAVVQRRPAPDPKWLVGQGKLKELAMLGLQRGVDLLVFGAALSPSQQRSIAAETGLRVIDRNQLILDIFARHAKSNEGRLQVELAQLRYNLPRLSEKDDAMSRLTGGIGAQGPGETKLELGRRRARERIHLLEQRLKALAADRAERRRRRVEAEVPVVALVGYTNAGKSTLFNALTGSTVLVQDLLFATLDPTVRRVFLPGGVAALLCDTVGFIRDLPSEIEGVFRATLEEVEGARLLVLVADASDPNIDEQVRSVRRILGDLGFRDRPQVLVLNKADRVADEASLALRASLLDALPASALQRATLEPVARAIASALEPIEASRSRSPEA